MNDFNKEDIVDSENFRSNQNFGYKQIVLSQVQRVVSNLSREQREGFWIYSSNPSQASEPIKYVGDSREESIQSIETLFDLILPKFDKTIKEETKDFEVNLKKECDDCAEKHDNAKNEADRKFWVKEYWKAKRKHYRKLFQQLCLFLERIGWLEAGEVEE